MFQTSSNHIIYSYMHTHTYIYSTKFYKYNIYLKKGIYREYFFVFLTPSTSPSQLLNFRSAITSSWCIAPHDATTIRPDSCKCATGHRYVKNVLELVLDLGSHH